MAYETLLLDREGAVAIVTLNRPAVLNALNTLMVRELKAAFAELESDAGVRAVVITGAGERAFAAGADIGELNALPNAIAAAALSRSGQELTLAIERSRLPVIAAVNGYALGGGCELALACDMRIASQKARFGQPEVNLGLIPGYGGTQRTLRLLGRGYASYLCLSGEQIGADEALRVGLADKVVAPEALLDEAKRLAANIGARAPLAVAATKRAIVEGQNATLTGGLEVEALLFGSAIDTNDFVEGTKAFLEKRAANFTGT